MKNRHLFGHVRRIWLIGLGGMLVAAIVFAAVELFCQPAVTVQIGSGVFVARLAQTDTERAQGLGGTAVLRSGHAMLFVFDRSDRWGIWMKDMTYPIDVVWLNEQKQVVYSVSSMEPTSYPKVFAPEQPARYVVELPAGAIARSKMTYGTVAQFTLPGGRR